MKKPITLRFISFTLIMLVSLTACSEQHIPLGEYRIEWDEHNPKLHGQVVMFNEPMAYDVFGPKDLANWKKEFIEIGRFLQSARRDSMTSYKREPVIDGMLFKVKGSFWIRNDWFVRDTQGDTRYLLMADENGIESVASFSRLAISSNRKDLVSMEDEGRFKE